MTTCTKRYSDYPFAHRQHLHDGHCAYIHGHNWGFQFTFAAKELDANGFVVDFGKLQWLKEFLTRWFDHTLLLNRADPQREYIVNVLSELALKGAPLADIRIVPDASCEGLARLVFELVNSECLRRYEGRVHLVSVVVFEDEKNSATFAP